MTSRSVLFGLAALLASPLPGCTDRADRAAKERIFSPEEPAAEVQRAAEMVRVEEASTDPAVWRRLWKMDRMEVTRRVGAHRAQAAIHFRWTRQGRQVQLGEEQKLETDPKGQFHASVQNDQDAGLEFVWADGHAYAKSRYGPYRARRIDHAEQDVWRDQATSALSTAFDLYARRLRASPLGRVDAQGHAAQKFALLLGEPWGPADERPALPPAVYGLVRAAKADPAKDPKEPAASDTAAKDPAVKEGFQPGPDDDTRRRLEMEERLVPQRVQGEVLVDQASAVILSANLKGHFQVPGEKGQPPAELDVEVKYDLTPDATVQIRAPENVAAPRMQHVVNDPLWFLGADAPHKAAAAEAPAAPHEDEEQADEPGAGDDEQPAAPVKKPGKK